jgi:hypothetical protein
MSDITFEELLQLHRIRKGKEPSRALERKHYGDPLNNIEYVKEIQRRERINQERKGRK